MVKVLVMWKPFDRLRNYLVNATMGWAECIFPEDLSEENLSFLARDADVIIGWKPTKRLLENAKKLKLFINPAAGVDKLIELFKHFPGVTLVNSHGNSYSTAQHGVALLLALTNQIIPHHNWMTEGKWRLGDKEAKSIPLFNKTLGILGFGAVGQKVARFCSGFDLKIIVFKNTPLDVKPPYVEKVFYGNQLHHFLKETDCLIITIPLNNKTENMIGLNELKLLGKEGLLVNIARGPVVNEKALYIALKENLIKGAACDVWYDYHPKGDSKDRKWPYHYPFHELTNIILSPHRAASPLDDLTRWDDVLINIRKVYEGKTDYLNIIDLGRGY